jgi:hypothetical protein
LVGFPTEELSNILDVALLQKGSAPFSLTYGEFDDFLTWIGSVCHGLVCQRRPWLAWAWKWHERETSNNNLKIITEYVKN